MRLLVPAVLVLAMTAGCMGSDTPDPGPRGQIDGAALDHVLIPYSNATVTLPDLGMATQTTELGGFSFFDVPVGFYVVELDLPGIGVDREVVAVHDQEITRVILQIYPHPADEPHVTLRTDAEIVELAMPGEVCEECAWRTTVSEARPAAVELLVEWDARHPAMPDWHTDLIVELRDQADRILAGPLTKADVVDVEGLSVLHVLVPGAAVPDDVTSLKVAFRFDADNAAPHPDFQVKSRLCLHYVETEGASACSV